jgi:hypothetical protein
MMEKTEDTVKIFEKHIKSALVTTHGIAAQPFWGGYKLFMAKGSKIQGFKWSYPVVDLRFYEITKESEVAMVRERFGKSFISYPLVAVLPLTDVAFEGASVKVPRDVNTVAKAIFGPQYLHECDSRNWDRRLERALSSTRVDCHKLQHMYYFTMYHKKGNLRRASK